MKEKFNITKKKLEELYINNNMRRIDVANYFGCSDALIKQKIKKYGLNKPHKLECENKKRYVECTCEYCGDNFKQQPFRLTNKKWNRIKYCSHKCSSDARFLGEDHKRSIANSIAARRRSIMKNCLDPERNECKIKEIYHEAKKITEETGIPHEVDNIIPISKGGKHHEDNLRVITRSENRKKGNKID